MHDREVRQALEELRRRTSNMKLAVHAIGDHLRTSTIECFTTLRGPDGTPWKPNTPATLEAFARKTLLAKGDWRKDGRLSKRGAAKLAAKKPLTGEGRLSDQANFHIEYGQDYALVGTNIKYAAVLQFGTKGGPSAQQSAGARFPGATFPPDRSWASRTTTDRLFLTSFGNIWRRGEHG
ncbi:MAG: phage virion morphogenesis protein [Tepidimonas sp.]|nr:phage virion morphogenesis protein [Tepidimonas sp.]MDT7929244.1 phage virion morphogenesis protein [Tepidimonas sp.]